VKVEAIEYDPNRTGYIARVVKGDGTKAYILAVDGMREGQVVKIGERVNPDNGNRLLVKNIPIGTFICNVELKPGDGGILARSAGAAVQLTAIDGGKAQLTLNSGEVRLVKDNCMATIGVVSNKNYHNLRLGKAGASRHRGKRPTVRGSVMNPVDHPHGGGEGRAPVGNRKGPKTPWGKLARGPKTRKKKKYSDKMIVRRRKK
jgi:large subunit ribosomal protein L2